MASRRRSYSSGDLSPPRRGRTRERSRSPRRGGERRSDRGGDVKNGRPDSRSDRGSDSRSGRRGDNKHGRESDRRDRRHDRRDDSSHDKDDSRTDRGSDWRHDRRDDSSHDKDDSRTDRGSDRRRDRRDDSSHDKDDSWTDRGSDRRHDRRDDSSHDKDDSRTYRGSDRRRDQRHDQVDASRHDRGDRTGDKRHVRGGDRRSDNVHDSSDVKHDRPEDVHSRTHRWTDGSGEREGSEGDRETAQHEFGVSTHPAEKAPAKEEPNFGLSGSLTADTNTYKGVVIAYSEPEEARVPKVRWRFYPFKGEEALPVLFIHRQSAYLIGRDRQIADIPVDHPSCSKQHCVLQYRLVERPKEDGGVKRVIRPYLIDLQSTNGTYINNQRIDPARYVELKEKDVVKFGFSSREYVLLHEQSVGAQPSPSQEEGKTEADQ